MRAAALPFESRCAALQCQRRFITRLYTSYYKGELFPNQLVRPTQRLPVGVGVAAARGKKGAGDLTGTNSLRPPASPSTAEGVSWKDATNTDLVHVNTMRQAGLTRGAPPRGGQRVPRPYVPLGEIAKIELQGDYLTEGGLHQEALESYGVVAKAYELAYREHHGQVIGAWVKLGGAFRRTGRLESSKAILERALASLDQSQQPSLELLTETLMELGLTAEAMKDPSAGTIYEEAVTVVDQFHNFGQSHKMLRLLPRLSRRFNLNFEGKFLYFSPFDYDRTFALVDQCLSRAESWYRAAGDREGVVRVLQQHKEIVDKKFFNMRDFAGRIHTMRGHWKRRAQVLTNAPTPEELLRYSPTLHQVYRDFKYELNAPIGRESEVQQGSNRVVQDMGNPYRRRGLQSRRMLRDADGNFAKYTRAVEFGA